MRQGLPGTELYRHSQLDRNASGALSVRDVAGAGGAGHPGVDAGTGRLKRGVVLNIKRNICREEYCSLNNRVTNII